MTVDNGYQKHFDLQFMQRLQVVLYKPLGQYNLAEIKTMSELDENRAAFYEQLKQYWAQTDLGTVKIPQIGGRELDFYKLYRAVLKRGGAQKVSSGKQWKEIVSEFGLPSTCTSASFTLRNHYRRYLLGFEQKYFFGRSDQDRLPELVAGRARYGTRSDRNGHHQTKSRMAREDVQQGDESDPSRPTKTIYNYRQSASELISHLTRVYSDVDAQEEVLALKRQRIYPQQHDLKRITLAFESKLKDELNFAANMLLLYSTNCHQNFQFENYKILLDQITDFIICAVQNIGYIQNIYELRDTSSETNNNARLIKNLDMFQNYNHAIEDILMYNHNGEAFTERGTAESDLMDIEKQERNTSPLACIAKRRKFGLIIDYEHLGPTFLFNTLCSLFLALRNFTLNANNASALWKQEKLSSIVLQLFILQCDAEIGKYCLEIIANCARLIYLSKISNAEAFYLRLFQLMREDSREQLESVSRILKYLIMTQQNEEILEKRLNSYLPGLGRMLLFTYGEICENTLEFLSFLTEINLNTKVTIARNWQIMQRLVALTAAGHDTNRRSANIAAVVLRTIACVPATIKYFIPFQHDIFLICSVNVELAKVLAAILCEIASYEAREVQSVN